MGHSISFAITLTMMVGITGYNLHCSRRREDRGHFFQYGPTYLTFMASILIMADLMRHVLQDADIWPEPSSRQYMPGCHEETFKCLSGIGWVFTIFCTYIGFAILMWGTMCECRSDWKTWGNEREVERITRHHSIRAAFPFSTSSNASLGLPKWLLSIVLVLFDCSLSFIILHSIDATLV